MPELLRRFIDESDTAAWEQIRTWYLTARLFWARIDVTRRSLLSGPSVMVPGEAPVGGEDGKDGLEAPDR